MMMDQDGTCVFTEGLYEALPGQAEIRIEAGDERFVETAGQVLAWLVHLCVEVGEYHRPGERIPLGLSIVEFIEGPDGALELHEAFPGDEFFTRGLARTCAVLTGQAQMLEALEDEGYPEGRVANRTPGLSAFVTTTPSASVAGAPVVMRRRGPAGEHSGWEVLAEEEQFNPARMVTMPLHLLLVNRPDLMVPLALSAGWQVGAEVDAQPEWREELLPQIDLGDAGTWEHTAPTARERADELVLAEVGVHDERVVWEQLPTRRLSADDPLLSGGRTVSTEPLAAGHHLAEVCAIPFFGHGFSLGDVVEVDEHFRVRALRVDHGRHVVRIVVSDMEAEEQAMAVIAGMGLAFEWASNEICVIDCPDASMATALLQQLEGLDAAYDGFEALPLTALPGTFEPTWQQVLLAHPLAVGLSALFGGTAGGLLAARASASVTGVSIAIVCTAVITGVLGALARRSTMTISTDEILAPRRYARRVAVTATLTPALATVSGLLLLAPGGPLPVTLLVALVVAAGCGTLARRRVRAALAELHEEHLAVPDTPPAGVPALPYRYVAAEATVERVERIEIMRASGGDRYHLHVSGPAGMGFSEYTSLGGAIAEAEALYGVRGHEWRYER